VLGKRKQENLNDNAVKTADNVTRMNQFCLRVKIFFVLPLPILAGFTACGSGCNYIV
jgi:hypothetical protein